jgi:hypothetical protein
MIIARHGTELFRIERNGFVGAVLKALGRRADFHP